MQSLKLSIKLERIPFTLRRTRSTKTPCRTASYGECSLTSVLFCFFSELDESHLVKMSKESKLSPEFVTGIFVALKNGILDTYFLRYLIRSSRKLKVEDYKVVETNL
jgi:hypothetical protein